MSLKPFFLCTIFSLLFSACAPLYHPVFPPNPNFIYSPKYPARPEVYHLQLRLPNRPIVIVGQESFVTQNVVEEELSQGLLARSLDGAIIFNEQYSSHEASREIPPSALSHILAAMDTSYTPEATVEYYTQHNFYCKFWPFIYLDSIENRKFLDRIELKIQSKDGKVKDYELSFDWFGQLKALPPTFNDECYKALLVQPWFFLQQYNSGWKERRLYNALFPSRKFQSGAVQARYAPIVGTKTMQLRYRSKYYQMYLITDKNGVWHTDALRRGSVDLNWEKEDFLGTLLKESWQDEDGTRYVYRYFYKNKEEVPADWIINPQSLLQH